MGHLEYGEKCRLSLASLGDKSFWVGCGKADRFFVATFAFAWILRLRALRFAQDDGDGGKG
jgi:hypothetical protein